MLRSIFVLTLLTTLNLCSAQADKVENLRGMDGIYWRVDTSYAQGISSSERMDLNDIVELQLRRGAITLKPYIANQPYLNIPQLEINISTVSITGPDQVVISVRVLDHATIERNSQRTIAKTFELTRRGQVNNGIEKIDLIKSELREIMTEFVGIYKKANP